MLDNDILVKHDVRQGGLLSDMKRVTTREFLRNINSMTEPVEVYTRATLKGTWLPNTTWSNIPSSGSVQTGAGAVALGDGEPRATRRRKQ